MTITDYLRQIRENAWSSRQLGAEFERFVKRYFKAEPFYASQFDEVWLWGECPFAKGNDVGIDLVARTKFGEYVAIQAKCYQPGTQVDKADVDTFLSASGKQIAPDGKATYYSQRIIIATNDNWTAHASEAIVDQQIPVTRIGLAQIQESAIDWEKFFAGAKKTIVKKTTRPHQDAAIADVIKGFKTRERGQLIMACGTGKTFTSLKIAESLCPANGHVLFLVPSISLLGQSLREWCEQAEKPLTAFADEGVVAFVTNGGWLDAQAMGGFRNALVNEFSHIYVFNLRGNQRTQGEVSRREGGKIFGSGSRTPVAITILVKGGKEAK